MLRNKVVLVETDSSSTKAYINHMDERKTILFAIARKIWHTALQYGIHLIALLRPGKPTRGWTDCLREKAQMSNSIR